MNLSLRSYQWLTLLAGGIFLLLIGLQWHWLQEALRLQREETHQQLRRIAPEIALAVNRLGHDTFHGDMEGLETLDMSLVQGVADSLLHAYELPTLVEVALYQEKGDGHFRSPQPASEAQLRASDIRACLSCIVSFSVAKSAERLPDENDEEYVHRITKRAEFQYFSPLDRILDEERKDILWLALYQPDASGEAFGQLRGLFGVNVLLLLLLLSLFGLLLRALYRHKQLGQAKDDLFSNLTHEFKTPLSSIRLASRMLAKPLPPDKQHSYLQLIERESAELERQVDQLLHVSLLDQTAIPLHRESIKLADMLSQLRRSFSAQLEASTTQFTVHLSDPDLRIEADRDHLFRSLSNLIDNSLKYGQHEGHIHLAANQHGHQVEIRVRDHGPGIAPEHQARVFERFYRGQKQNQYKGKGFGIGLSYVKSVLEAHGGSIDLNPAYSSGTEFIVRI